LKSPAISEPKIASQRISFLRAISTMSAMLPFEQGASRKRTASQTGKAGRYVLPGVQPMTREIELCQHVLINLLQPEARPDPVEHAPMNHIELGEWNAARAHLVHPRLILRAPRRISEREPVKRIAQRLEDRLSLARNPRAPIDHRAEYVEEQRSHVIFRFLGCT
jgi:hypothetical protein